MDNATSMQREKEFNYFIIPSLSSDPILYTPASSFSLLRKKSFMHVMLNICQKINMKCEKILHSPSSQLILPSIIVIAMICISVYQPKPPRYLSLSQCMCFIVTSSFISLLFLYIHLTLHHCEIFFKLVAAKLHTFFCMMFYNFLSLFFQLGLFVQLLCSILSVFFL